ncbi:MAG: ATPase [Firmicutes bacterium]|nr:ATPase [Bacillota bacterium]
MSRRNIVILLDRLQEVVESAPKIPLSGRSLVDEDEILDLVAKIRTALPEEMRRADALSSERDRILEDGQRRAERIIAQAEEQAARLLRESEIIQLAQREAERIVTEAREQAYQLGSDARAYAKQLLEMLQKSLSENLTVVESGLENLDEME